MLLNFLLFKTKFFLKFFIIKFLIINNKLMTFKLSFYFISFKKNYCFLIIFIKEGIINLFFPLNEFPLNFIFLGLIKIF